MVTLVLLFTVATSMSFAQTKIRAGIIDFVGKSGVSADEASTIADIFRGKMVLSKKYQVLERSKMSAILSEQSFQKTGCTESECAVQLGKLLNMEKMMYGTVSKLGGKYYIIINVVNIETAQVENNVTKNVDSFDYIEQAMSDTVAHLEGRSVPERTKQMGVARGGAEPEQTVTLKRKDKELYEKLPNRANLSFEEYINSGIKPYDLSDDFGKVVAKTDFELFQDSGYTLRQYKYFTDHEKNVGLAIALGSTIGFGIPYFMTDDWWGFGFLFIAIDVTGYIVDALNLGTLIQEKTVKSPYMQTLLVSALLPRLLYIPAYFILGGDNERLKRRLKDGTIDLAKYYDVTHPPFNIAIDIVTDSDGLKYGTTFAWRF